MKAIVVHDHTLAPKWDAFQEPVETADLVVVTVVASALSNLTKAIAAGKHYSSQALPPFVPGVDGVGKLANGQLVYFSFPEKPFGAMGEKTLVRRNQCVALPQDLDPIVAASIANPAMSSWAALTRRAHLKRGEHVLINGATGSSGRMAIAIARHLGAKRIVATGRDPEVLRQLQNEGADVVLSLKETQEKTVASVRHELITHGIDVVLDYLWGASAEALLAAIGGPGSHHSDKRVRFVQIGSISGHSIPIPASILRSTALELMGSGLGSVADADLTASISDAFQVATKLQLSVEKIVEPFTSVEKTWNQDFGSKRLVYVMR